MMKKQNGITLIALVITIIVLLILAGVSIAMLTGDNGILTKATTAKSTTSKAEVMEKINMELNGQMANAMAGDPFDAKATIEKNLALKDGKIGDYTITVTADATQAATLETTASVTIAITSDNKTDFDTNEGKVEYDTAKKVWTITPIAVTANTDASSG